VPVSTNIRGEVIGSVMQLKCSPIQTSSKPSRSVRMIVSRSSYGTA